MNWHPFTRVGPAIGITLWKWNRKKIELWWTPKDYSPQEHAHDGCDGEFTILWAKNRRIYRKGHVQSTYFGLVKTEAFYGYIPGFNPQMLPRLIGPGDEYIANTPQVWGKWLTVPAGVPHKFEKGDSFMLWIVVEKWKPGYDMSLASDFRVTE